MSKFNKNSTDQQITEQLRKEGYSDKRIASFLRGWYAVKNYKS
jgi:microsomal dipeptidase-like Zn-dependent dipeptidase